MSSLPARLDHHDTHPFTPRPRRRATALTALLAGAGLAWVAAPLPTRAADQPWNLAVQVTAAVNEADSQITLSWPAADPIANDGYQPEETVYRKAVADLDNDDWGSGTTLAAGQTSFTDTVEPGVAYEYRIERHYQHWGAEYYGYGYIRTGIRLPLVEHRGTVLLVVENSVAAPLSGELDQLRNDLIGDGWRVVRIDEFNASSNPADLQQRIRSEYRRTEQNVQAVFLLGHLPVVLSGTETNPDGHFIRPMPADGFYGDMSGDWGTPTYDGSHWIYPANTFPAPLALQVGRVDFSDLPAVYAASPFTSELDLLRNYLAKDHAFRTAQRVPQRRALIGDAFGEYYWEGVEEPFSADGYRNFAPLFGDQLTVADNFHGDPSGASQWLSQVSNQSFLWAFGCGPGGDSANSMGGLGPNGIVTSTDLITQNARADFYMFFGSFLVDWARTDNLMRAALAPADYGLACAWTGRPFLYFHAMGTGETIGYGLRISENRSGSLYQTPVTVRPSGNRYDHGVYLALMGDPTLRLDPVPPVRNVVADATTGAAAWLPPENVAVEEYRVYRLKEEAGTFELTATLPALQTVFVPTRTGTYMVRAVTLQHGSGTYLNASEGAIWTTNGVTLPVSGPTGEQSAGTPEQSTGSFESTTTPAAPVTTTPAPTPPVETAPEPAAPTAPTAPSTPPATNPDDADAARRAAVRIMRMP